MTERGVGLVLKDLSSADIARIAGPAESAGITHLFLPETGILGLAPGRDPVLSSAAALRETSMLRVGPGIAATPIRAARLMGIQAATVNEESGGRYICGIGVSHKTALEAQGLTYPARALDHLRDYTRALKEISATAAYGQGFPVMIGALGPKMVALAASESDGIVLNWLTPSSAAGATADIRRTAEQAGNAEPATPLFVRTGPIEAVRFDATNYHDNLPNYRKHFHGQGLTTVDEVIERACMPLDAGAIAERVGEYAAAGITIPCVYPTGMTPDEIITLLGSLTGRLG